MTLEAAVWSALAKLKIDRGDATLSDTLAWLLELPRYAVGVDPGAGDDRTVTAEVTPPGKPDLVVVRDGSEQAQGGKTDPAAPSPPPAAPDVGNDASDRRPRSGAVGTSRTVAAVVRAVPGLKTGRDLADQQKGDI